MADTNKPLCNDQVYKLVAIKFNLTEKEAKEIVQSQFKAIAFKMRGRIVGRFLISKVGSLYFDMDMYIKHKKIEEDKQRINP